MLSPCKGCGDRVVGCHTSCKKYMAYRLLLDCKTRMKYIDHIADSYAMMRSRNFRDYKLRNAIKDRRK